MSEKITIELSGEEYNTLVAGLMDAFAMRRELSEKWREPHHMALARQYSALLRAIKSQKKED